MSVVTPVVVAFDVVVPSVVVVLLLVELVELLELVELVVVSGSSVSPRPLGSMVASFDVVVVVVVVVLLELVVVLLELVASLVLVLALVLLSLVLVLVVVVVELVLDGSADATRPRSHSPLLAVRFTTGVIADWVSTSESIVVSVPTSAAVSS